ncbi:hypothetical protein [Paenibacillus sp. SYP-B3998]|uniref:hypothetical protein n=1 Tax=Paenibacillus sp. SYP-B3998 TaxID=2678564 RepID=UPI0031F7E6BB
MTRPRVGSQRVETTTRCMAGWVLALVSQPDAQGHLELTKASGAATAGAQEARGLKRAD